MRKLRCQQNEALYDTLLYPPEGRGLASKTVYEIHLIMRGSLNDAVHRVPRGRRATRISVV